MVLGATKALVDPMDVTPSSTSCSEMATPVASSYTWYSPQRERALKLRTLRATSTGKYTPRHSPFVNTLARASASREKRAGAKMRASSEPPSWPASGEAGTTSGAVTGAGTAGSTQNMPSSVAWLANPLKSATRTPNPSSQGQQPIRPSETLAGSRLSSSFSIERADAADGASAMAAAVSTAEPKPMRMPAAMSSVLRAVHQTRE